MNLVTPLACMLPAAEFLIWGQSIRYLTMNKQPGKCSHYCPIAAVSNCHKHSGLKQYKSIVLQLWRSKV